MPRQINLRLYPDKPDHQEILRWIDSLPKNQRGAKDLKAHIFCALRQYINGAIDNKDVQPLLTEKGEQGGEPQELDKESSLKESSPVDEDIKKGSVPEETTKTHVPGWMNRSHDKFDEFSKKAAQINFD